MAPPRWCHRPRELSVLRREIEDNRLDFGLNVGSMTFGSRCDAIPGFPPDWRWKQGAALEPKNALSAKVNANGGATPRVA